MAYPIMETMLLKPALTCYLIATLIAYRQWPGFKALLGFGLIIHGMAIIERWLASGHGPYLGLYDSLSSNLWLQLFLLSSMASLNQTLNKAFITGLTLALPFILWLFILSPQNHTLPPTYATPWFYLHLFSGKLAYALLFIAIAVSVFQLRQQQAINQALRQLMLTAFICHSLLLFAGANWAYLAWGKYWDWNPLEIWSLLTWLGFGLFFHRPGVKMYRFIPDQQGMVVVIYLFAVLGFYGIPFLSHTAHQGLV